MHELRRRVIFIDNNIFVLFQKYIFLQEVTLAVYKNMQPNAVFHDEFSVPVIFYNERISFRFVTPCIPYQCKEKKPKVNLTSNTVMIYH